jgi:hypothetical protein
MPEILNSINSTSKYAQNPTSAIQPTAEQIQSNSITDPNKVNRTDKSFNQQQDEQGDLGQIRYDSNYQSFIQRLDSTPSPAASLTALIMGHAGAVGTDDALASQLSSAMEAANLTQDQLMEFLSQQLQSGSRFQGALFSLLRGAYSKASTDNLQTDILQFLKSYLDYASTDHIEGRILGELDQMADAMPDRWSVKLEDLSIQLKNGVAAGDREGNLGLIRRSVIPLMSQYVDATHDMGLPRKLLSLLTLDLARYENGSKENLLQTFHQLKGYAALKNQLGAINDEALMKLLKTEAFSAPSAANQFADRLADSATLAMRGTGNAETQQAVQQLVAAMLMNESVYMPVNHYLLPFEQSFADLWVDPNDRDGASDEGQNQSAVKLLLQINTPSFGRFDVVVTDRDLDVDIQIACPDGAVPFSKEIEQSVSKIVTDCGLNPTGVQARGVDRPLTLSQVFPKIYEGRDSVNVKV